MFEGSRPGMAEQDESGKGGRQSKDQGAANANGLRDGDEGCELQAHPRQKAKNEKRWTIYRAVLVRSLLSNAASLMASPVNVTHRRDEYGWMGPPAQ